MGAIPSCGPIWVTVAITRARPVSGVPSNAATCFCSATRASARSARCCHRLISPACSASFLSRGSATRRTGPRFFGAPASSPRSRAARHIVRWEEYSPSRRSNAPTPPGVLQASASRTIFRLYSTGNRRRVALVTTSIAGPTTACSNAAIALHSCLALDSKLQGGHCLTHIGREGQACPTPKERRRHNRQKASGGEHRGGVAASSSDISMARPATSAHVGFPLEMAR
jgi:hypothetical protein